MTSKGKQRREQEPTTWFEIRESQGLEDWDAPDTEHLVLHQRHPSHPDWAVTATFEVGPSSAVLTGLFVRPAAEWAPPGGLTRDVVGSIRLTDLSEKVLARLKTREVSGYLGIDPTQYGPPKHRGRRGRTDLDYARLAQRYVALLDNPTPVKVFAKELHMAESSLRVLIYNARKRGLLTPAAPGRAGGKLTNKTIWLLAAADDENGQD